MKKGFAATILAVLLSVSGFTQTTFPANGAPFNVHSTYAFINANIYSDYETLVRNGVLLISDGKVISVGEKTKVPANAIVYDLKGKYIYPSFIDIFSDYGIPQLKFEKKSPGPQMESTVKGAFGWNQAIRSNIDASRLFVHSSEKAEDLKKNGFGSVVCASRDGIVRGCGALVNLNNTKRENESIIIDRAAAYYSFSKGSSPQDYPSSLTGAIALLRQTFYDAAWYQQNKTHTEYNVTLEEFNRLQPLPAVFDAGDKFNELRAARVGKEFNVKYIIKGSGNEYQRMNEIKGTFLKFIVPLNFPDAYDVEDPYDAEIVTFGELKHWELAPANPAELEKNNIQFCFTAADLKDRGLYLKNIRKAVQYGLSEKTALKAMTANPALFVNAYDRIGALKPGFYANFIIASRPIFQDDASIIQHWIAGEPNVYSELDIPEIRGNYTLFLPQKSYSVTFTGDISKPKATIRIDTAKKDMSFSLINNILTFSFPVDSDKVIRANGNYRQDAKQFDGRGQYPDGSWFAFSMKFNSMVDTATKEKKPARAGLNLGKVIYPFTAYGEPLVYEGPSFKDSWNKQKGKAGTILIKDATVWTNETDSAMKEYDVLIVDGKISRIAQNIDVTVSETVRIIDGKGKHLTPGIIDEHSHIAISAGVNEGAEASSAEVRMGDVINPEDINIYRQLAGGVTTSQLLHGSANPIGGQSALIKLRWGHSAEDMKYEKADPFIKFALGENVKQSNWGDLNTIRFPQSRMGVEQVFNDFFTRAREYDKTINAKSKAVTPRRDLELEALAEILNKKRFITCHSYVQSEINMLMHVADSFGFKVNTFTHILEGYKVADKMKAHGVSASTFSDWWAYKNEVMEAIPYNAALLTKVGVNTAINSDDAEMARRLNQEAAKCVKYGGLSEVEALKLVTLNPAKMLHIDNEVGSIKAGKSADVVLWTDHPLSVYAMADKTIIDGRIYFDREDDLRLRNEMRIERARIISKLLAEKQKGARVGKPVEKKPKLYHCNTIEGVDETITGHR